MIDRNYGDRARERRERAVRALEGEPPTSEAQPRRRMSGVRTRHYRCRWAVAESATPSSVEKGSNVVQDRLIKPNVRGPCEPRANVMECPRVPARDSRWQLRHTEGPFAGPFAKPSTDSNRRPPLYEEGPCVNWLR